MNYRVSLCLFILFGLLVVPGHADERILRMASTTSTEASGLLDVLIPVFERQSGYTVALLVTGSGKALQIGRRGEADLLWVHSPATEKAFIREGYGLRRHRTMSNDYLIVGPKNDPAGVCGSATAIETMQRIAETEALFLSRGDDSGTHNAELGLWNLSEVDPYGRWYYELGLGMKLTLQVANEKQGYVLVDRATWLFNQTETSLKECFQGDPALVTEYSLIAINPDRHDGINHAGAKAFIDFATSTTGQSLITGHQVRGQNLFSPATSDHNAGP